MSEDKAAIVKALFPVLKMTRQYSDLQSLEYRKITEGYEIVTAEFPGGKAEIGVTYDSGTAMIRDIMRGLP